MKRRIILMGGKTYVVSIPSEYIRKYDLKKGDELFFEDNGSNLVFRNEKAKMAEKLIITIKEQDNLGKVMKCLYERGYDEIEIIFENRTFDELGKILMQFPGFELILSGKGSCTIRCISNINAKEFENMLRRIFLIIKSIPGNMENNKKEASLKIITAQRLTVLCKRCLSKKEFQNYSKTLIYYSLLNEIDGILSCYVAAIKEKTFPTKELTIATEEAYNTFYTENHVNIKIPIIKSNYYAASIGISLSKIIYMIQSLKIA